MQSSSRLFLRILFSSEGDHSTEADLTHRRHPSFPRPPWPRATSGNGGKVTTSERWCRHGLSAHPCSGLPHLSWGGLGLNSGRLGPPGGPCPLASAVLGLFGVSVAPAVTVSTWTVSIFPPDQEPSSGLCCQDLGKEGGGERERERKKQQVALPDSVLSSLPYIQLGGLGVGRPYRS